MFSRIAVLLALLVTTAYCTNAYGDPQFQVTAGGIVITLYDDKCALSEVANLPFKATWVEDGKTVEGCWAPYTKYGVVASYFADKTVAIVPIGVFGRVQGI